MKTPLKVRNYFKEWAKKNPDKIKEYAIKNREKRRQYNKKFRNEINPEYFKSYCSKWLKDNPEKRRLYHRRYYHNVLKNSLNYKIKRNLKKRIQVVIKNKTKSLTTEEFLGISIKEFRLYIENMFTNGMSWDNYGEWHIDHIKPCVSFNLKDINEQQKCFHYTNLQPLWASDNFKKGSKIISLNKMNK